MSTWRTWKDFNVQCVVIADWQVSRGRLDCTLKYDTWKQPMCVRWWSYWGKTNVCAEGGISLGKDKCVPGWFSLQKHQYACWRWDLIGERPIWVLEGNLTMETPMCELVVGSNWEKSSLCVCCGWVVTGEITMCLLGVGSH